MVSASCGGHRKTNRLAQISAERAGGEMNIAPSQRLELKGVPQLYSTHQSMWKCFLFKLLTARTVLLRLWLEACQADVHEETFIMQCFSLA